MKTKFALTHGLMIALFALSAGRIAAAADAAPPKPTFVQDKGRPLITIMEMYEERLSALQAERRKFKAGKSTLFQVHQFAKDVRDVELQMSSTATQRVAALARYGILVRAFENEATTELERVMTRKWREDADSDLLRARRDVE